MSSPGNYANTKAIYVGNILESYYRSYDLLDSEKRKYWYTYDALENNRSLLYGKDNKLIITPRPIYKTHFTNICHLAGWKNTWNLFPKKHSHSICEDIVNTPDLFECITNTLRENPGMDIIPYRNTPEFYTLIKTLREMKLDFNTPETLLNEDLFIERYFHSKRGFRHIWEQTKNNDLKINIPEGFIVADKKELFDAAYWFCTKKRNFVIKYNRGVQGIGVEMFNWQDFPTKHDEFNKAFEEKLNNEMWNEGCNVIEEKADTDVTVLGGTPNVEMRIHSDGSVTREYACEQVMDPDGKTFRGVSMNPEVTHNKHIEQAYLAAELIGKSLSSFGYRGVYDMDLVITKDDRVYAVESNLRRTGGTHAHEFLQNLLGDKYYEQYYCVSYDSKISPNSILSYEKIMEYLGKNTYNPVTKEGVLLVNPDMLSIGSLSVLLVGRSRKDVSMYTNTIDSLIAQSS